MTEQTPPTIKVDLELPASERWQPLRPYADAMHELMSAFGSDLGSTEGMTELVLDYAQSFVTAELRQELETVAELAGVPFSLCVATNLYYDALKHMLGCTAFAVDTALGPLHARNLDWWNPGGLLTRNTMRIDFHRGGRAHFTTIAWPGFVGALSGVAHGRFAITLNAVLSEDPVAHAPPVTFLLRDLLDTAVDYHDALQRLQKEEILSDCLLLLSGTKRGEVCVIERTPTRSALRVGVGGRVVATNDYRVLDAQSGARDEVLFETACERFDRCTELLSGDAELDAGRAFALLSDPGVLMEITAQQMVFRAKSGESWIQLPDSSAT